MQARASAPPPQTSNGYGIDPLRRICLKPPFKPTRGNMKVWKQKHFDCPETPTLQKPSAVRPFLGPQGSGSSCNHTSMPPGGTWQASKFSFSSLDAGPGRFNGGRPFVKAIKIQGRPSDIPGWHTRTTLRFMWPGSLQDSAAALRSQVEARMVRMADSIAMMAHAASTSRGLDKKAS